MVWLFICVLNGCWVSNEFNRPTVLVDRVGLIELNHLYDLRGHYTFSQLIFWEFDPATRRKHVRAWTLLEPTPSNKWPIKNIETGVIESTWVDGRIRRRVHSMSFRESWTQDDPERADKKNWPESLREGLTQMPKQPKETDEVDGAVDDASGGIGWGAGQIANEIVIAIQSSQ